MVSFERVVFQMKSMVIRIWVYVMVLIVLTSVALVKAENWPCFRGPSRQGMSQEQNVPVKWSNTENVLWKTPIPGEAWSSPIVWGERVFLTTATDSGMQYRLLCLDRDTGSVL